MLQQQACTHLHLPSQEHQHQHNLNHAKIPASAAPRPDPKRSVVSIFVELHLCAILREPLVRIKRQAAVAGVSGTLHHACMH